MSFQMLCGWAAITHQCLNGSGLHQPRKRSRLPVLPALLRGCVGVCGGVCVCVCVCVCMLQCQRCSCPALAPLTQWQHLVPSGRILQCRSTSDLSESLPLIIHNCFFKKGIEGSITNT